MNALGFSSVKPLLTFAKFDGLAKLIEIASQFLVVATDGVAELKPGEQVVEKRLESASDSDVSIAVEMVVFPEPFSP